MAVNIRIDPEKKTLKSQFERKLTFSNDLMTVDSGR